MNDKGMNRAGEGIVRAGYENKTVEKRQQKVIKTKWIFTAASSFN